MAIVTSKFRKDFIVKAFSFSMLALAILIKYILYSIRLAVSSQWYPFSITGGFFLLFAYLFFRLFRYTLVNVTVAPEGIVWKSLTTNKIITIGYEDIEHVTCFMTNTGGRSYSSYRTVQIDLVTGKELSFTDAQFGNYTELIDAIRECRRMHAAH